MDSTQNEQHEEEVSSRLFEQALELWINPEIERRRDQNRLPDGFVIHSVQVVMNFDKPIEVRLNEEVKAILSGKATRAIEAGEEVNIDEVFSEILDVSLTEKDSNAGHLTMIYHRGFWHMHFDFRYNAKRSLDHAKTAEEFLNAAKSSLKRQNLRAFVDNLFSATELIAKALLLMHDQGVFESKKHSAVHSRYNQFGSFGNIDSRFTNLLNRLAKLRPSARYVKTDLTLSTPDGKEMLSIANEMLRDIYKRIPRIVDTSNGSPRKER